MSRTEKKVQAMEEACAEKPSYKNNFGYVRPLSAPPTARISKSRSEKNNGRFYWWVKGEDGELEYFKWADEVDENGEDKITTDVNSSSPVSKKKPLQLVKLFTKNPPAPSANIVKPVAVRPATPTALPAPFKSKSTIDVRTTAAEQKSLTAFNTMTKLDAAFEKFVKEYREDQERITLKLQEIQKQVEGIEYFLVTKSAEYKSDAWIDTRKRKVEVDDDDELTQEFVEKKKKSKSKNSSDLYPPQRNARRSQKKNKQLDLTIDSPPRVPEDLKSLTRSLCLLVDSDDDVKDAKVRSKK